MPMPSSVVVIQGKSSFHDGSIPVRHVFDGGLLELEDDLRFNISLTHEVLSTYCASVVGCVYVYVYV